MWNFDDTTARVFYWKFRFIVANFSVLKCIVVRYCDGFVSVLKDWVLNPTLLINYISTLAQKPHAPVYYIFFMISKLGLIRFGGYNLKCRSHIPHAY